MKKQTMKRFIIILVLVSTGWAVKAQQLEQWTQFYMNEYLINPAVCGSDPYFNARAMFRNQWVGIVDAPRTYYLSVHGPIVGDKMGLGGAVFSDVLGAQSKSGLQLSYAYHLKLSDVYKLSFSLSTGFFQFAVNGAELGLQDAHDVALSNGNMVVWTPDFGASTRFSGKNFHVGFYVPQVANLQAQFFDDFTDSDNFLARHYYLNAGYKYEINSDFAVEGNFLGRYAGLDMFDFQARGIFREMVWLGLLYRTPFIDDQAPTAFGMMAGYQFENNLTIGYSYDMDLGKIGNATSGSHEVVLGIHFTKKNTKSPVN